VYCEARKAEDVLCQFVNGLKKDQTEILIWQADLLKTPVQTVVKRIATLEEESGRVPKVSAISESGGGDNPTGASNQLGETEETVSRMVEQKLGQLAKSSLRALCLQLYGGEENVPVGRDLAQSPLMFAELAMAAPTGLVAAQL